MKVSNPFQAIAKNPVERIIRVHAKSISKARKNRGCDAFVANAPLCDARQGRIIINALRREIDRLLRGIDRYALCHRPQFADSLKGKPSCDGDGGGGGSDSARSETAQLASAPQTRKSYAVAALGPKLSPQTLAAIGNTDNTQLNSRGFSSGEQLIDLIA